jgi:hypothetical protein
VHWIKTHKLFSYQKARSSACKKITDHMKAGEGEKIAPDDEWQRRQKVACALSARFRPHPLLGTASATLCARRPRGLHTAQEVAPPPARFDRAVSHNRRLYGTAATGLCASAEDYM